MKIKYDIGVKYEIGINFCLNKMFIIIFYYILNN